jgi:hypothetical protein
LNAWDVTLKDGLEDEEWDDFSEDRNAPEMDTDYGRGSRRW